LALHASPPVTARRKFVVRAASPGEDDQRRRLSGTTGGRQATRPGLAPRLLVALSAALSNSVVLRGWTPRAIRAGSTLAPPGGSATRESRTRNRFYDGLTIMFYPLFTPEFPRVSLSMFGVPLADVSWPSHGFCGLPARKPRRWLWRPGNRQSTPECSAQTIRSARIPRGERPGFDADGRYCAPNPLIKGGCQR
jgi:hypothetical protein